MVKKEFSIKDIRTLKNLNKDKLDFYIDYLKTYKKVERVSLEEAPEVERKVIRHFSKNAKWYYKYTEILLDIVDIFKEYPSGQEPQFNVANDIRKILEDGSHLDVMTPNLINFYINEVIIQDRFEHGVIVDNIEKGYFLTLLKLLKKQLQQYLKNTQYYEDKYGAENLLTLDEDCENGRKAGNMAVATSTTWEEDWKEFIKHDMQWDPGFFYFLIVHKLKLMREYFDPDNGNTSLCRRSAKRDCRQIDKALELAAFLNDDKWVNEATKDIKDVRERIKIHDKLWKQATRRFFLYLANHYEGWWD